MSRPKHPHECEVPARLECASLLLAKLEILGLGGIEAALALPLQRLSPGPVAEPVADIIRIAGVDQDWDLLEDAGDEAVEWLHPVALEQEVAVDVEVARVVRRDLSAKCVDHILLVEVLGDPAQRAVAEVGGVLALTADVVDVLAGALVGPDERVVAVDAGGHAGPHALALVAVLDQGLAAGEGVVHSLAFAVVENSRPAAVTAGHGLVVLVLGQAVGEAVADEDGLDVDIALLVRENLGSEDWDVVAGIRLTRNVEILGRILGELLEEEGEEGIDILAGGDGVADGASTVGIAYVDGLIEEDDGSVGIPGVWVAVKLELLIKRCWAKLEEESGERRAAWAAVEPENDGIILGVVARLEEP